MADPRQRHIYLPLDVQADLRIIAAEMAREGRPQVVDLKGNMIISAVIQHLIADEKERLQATRTPWDAALSLWDYLTQKLSLPASS